MQFLDKLEAAEVLRETYIDVAEEVWCSGKLFGIAMIEIWKLLKKAADILSVFFKTKNTVVMVLYDIWMIETMVNGGYRSGF